MGGGEKKRWRDVEWGWDGMACDGMRCDGMRCRYGVRMNESLLVECVVFAAW